MITDRGFISGVNQANVPVLGLFDGTGAAKVLARVTYTALKTFYVLMEIIVIAIFGAGITLAYYLPLAPALMFSLAVVGWIILVLEALVAAPIWAAAHAMPTGDGLTGDHGSRGYPFMMDLLFRPVLLVFALFMCIGVMNASLWFVMSMLEIAFKAEMAGSMMGLLSIIIGLVIITMAVFATVNRSIEIISWLPGSVIRWFGQGQGQDTGESKHTATVAAGASGGQYADKIASSSSSHTSMAQGVKPSKGGK